jgi:hypothetical protein
LELISLEASGALPKGNCLVSLLSRQHQFALSRPPEPRNLFAVPFYTYTANTTGIYAEKAIE